MGKTKAMTYRELRALVNSLTEEQLNREVMWADERRSGKVQRVEILVDDQVCPSGEEWESIVDYEKYMKEQDPDFDLKNDLEPIVCHKGQPILHVTE